LSSGFDDESYQTIKIMIMHPFHVLDEKSGIDIISSGILGYHAWATAANILLK
jgi:hypothetical protein